MIINLLVLGLCTGFMSGLLGIGGGVIMVPSLMFLLGISIKEAMGISLLAIVPTALMGFSKCYQSGLVDIRTSVCVMTTSVVGAYLGATVMAGIPTKTLKMIFGIFLILIGLNTLFDWTGSLGKQKQADALTSLK
jgi:uncharacterized protein